MSLAGGKRKRGGGVGGKKFPSKKFYCDDQPVPATKQIDCLAPAETSLDSFNEATIDAVEVEEAKPTVIATIIATTITTEGDEGQEKNEFETKVVVEEEENVKLYGTLVVWEGNPTEPVFTRKKVKKGRFYIVNCGESKGLNNRCNKPTENLNNSCTCCAGGCPSLSNQFDPECTKRVNRRRPKGPKKVQLVTKEEHNQILSSFIEEKKYKPDFKVDSLFPPPQDDLSHNNQQMIETAAPKRTRLQNKMVPSKHHHHHHSSKQPPSQACADKAMEEEQIVSFIVRGNEELVDDVAGYEMVDSNVIGSDQGGTSNDLNPEFGISLSCDDEMQLGGGDQRQKRPYRMRKVPNKEMLGEIVCDPTGKPRCTYTDLIEKALQQSSCGLTVSEIYSWISSNYPYFQVNDDRWKNSVRHNLSINPYFKGDKARNGAGHLWVISEEGKGIRPPIRRKSGSDLMDTISYDPNDIIPIRNETDRAISVILSEYAVASMEQQNTQPCGGDEDQQCEESSSSPLVTYIQIPNEIAIGQSNDNTQPNGIGGDQQCEESSSSPLVSYIQIPNEIFLCDSDWIEFLPEFNNV